MPIWEDFEVSFQAYLITAGLAFIVVAPVYMSMGSRRLLPMQRLRSVRWHGAAVWIAFLLFFLVPEITRGTLEELGFYEAVLGQAASPMLKTVWAAPLFSFSWLAILYWVMFAEFGVRPADFGLSRARGLRYLVVGYGGFLMLTPLILVLHAVAKWAQSEFFHGTPEPHPLELLAKEPLDIVDWGLIFFLAIISAPVMEEVLCRGILQGWLRRASPVGHISVALLTVLLGLAAFMISLPASGEAPTKEPTPGPLIFAALMAFIYGCLVYTAHRRWSIMAPIFGSAMVWSALHSLIWPSPVALMPLGLALGYLAYRTQSLVPCLVLHGLFNTVPSIAVLLKSLND